MSKYKYALWMVILAIAIISVITYIIYNINKINVLGKVQANVQVNTEKIDYSKTDNKDTINEIISTNTTETTKISPNAIIIFNKYYKSCKHTIIERESITEDMVNLNQTEFKKLYSDWEIEKFSSTEITLYKEYDGECGEHYLVKENNGYISIYKVLSNNDLQLIEDTQISTNCLPDMDVKGLKEGVSLVGKDELNAYIENFE